MTDRIILPTADVVIAPVVAKIIEKRPNSAPYLNGRTGVYWHPVLGFRGQAAKMLQRLSLLAAERRLKTAEGKALLDYVASEFDTVPETDKTFAEGTVTLGRGTDPEFPGGDYPAGTRITRSSYTFLGVTLPSAEYETLTDAHIDVNSTAPVVIPIRAIRAGAHADQPILLGDNLLTEAISLPPLVDNVVVTGFEAGGGSEGPDDPFVRQFARVFASGQYGPTSDASRLGALSATGVRHYLVFDEPVGGTQTVLIADSQWGSSDRWAGIVQQSIYDAELVGFGLNVYVRRVRSKVITVDAAVSLRSGTYLADTTEIDIAVQQAVRSYFDDRLDWNTWNAASLRAAIGRAHKKVYSCSSVVVRDAATGVALPEILSPDYSTEQFHLELASNAMKLTYAGPS